MFSKRVWRSVCDLWLPALFIEQAKYLHKPHRAVSLACALVLFLSRTRSWFLSRLLTFLLSCSLAPSLFLSLSLSLWFTHTHVGCEKQKDLVRRTVIYTDDKQESYATWRSMHGRNHAAWHASSLLWRQELLVHTPMLSTNDAIGSPHQEWLGPKGFTRQIAYYERKI